MDHHKRRAAGAALLALSLFLLAGCGQSKAPEQGAGLIDQPAVLYFANNDYVMSGDDQHPHLMPPVETTVKAEPGKEMAAVVEALKTAPDQAGYATLISKDLVINGVTAKDGTAFVDLGQEHLNGSSMEEEFLVDEIVETLIASFPDVREVQFLVDGQIAETLMGHLDASVPFTSKLKGE